MRLGEAVAVIGIGIVGLLLAFDYGRTTVPKQCALVQGFTPLYTQGDTCVFARDYGRAKYRENAL